MHGIQNEFYCVYFASFIQLESHIIALYTMYSETSISILNSGLIPIIL